MQEGAGVSYPIMQGHVRRAAREKEFRAQGLFAIGVIDMKGENMLVEKIWEGEHEEKMPCCPEEVEPWGGFGRPVKYYDNVTGKPLGTNRVEDVRAEEIAYFREKRGV